MLANTMTATEQTIMDRIGALVKGMSDVEKDKLLTFAEGMATMAALQQRPDHAPEARA